MIDMAYVVLCIECWLEDSVILVRLPTAAGYLSLLPYSPGAARVPTQLPFKWTPVASYLVAMRSGLEDLYFPPFNVDVQNTWNYISSFPSTFFTWCLIKHWNSFIFNQHYSRTLHMIRSHLDTNSYLSN